MTTTTKFMATFAIATALTLASLPIATSTQAVAQKVISAPEIYTGSKDKLAVSGYDPVAYFTDRAPTKGQSTITTSHQGVTWRFASEANKVTFLTDPAKYAPQYGGYCAYAVSQGYTASADPTVWEIIDGKLYLNYNRSVGTSWSKQARGYIKAGDAHWQRRKVELNATQ